MFHETNAIYIGMSRENWIRQMSFIFAIILRQGASVTDLIKISLFTGQFKYLDDVNLTSIPPTSTRNFQFLFPETPRTAVRQYLSLLFEIDSDIVLHVTKL